MADGPNDLNDPNNQRPKNIIDIDPVTVMVVIGALLLIPLLITGFFAQ